MRHRSTPGAPSDPRVPRAWGRVRARWRPILWSCAETAIDMEYMARDVCRLRRREKADAGSALVSRSHPPHGHLLDGGSSGAVRQGRGHVGLDEPWGDRVT